MSQPPGAHRETLWQLSAPPVGAKGLQLAPVRPLALCVEAFRRAAPRDAPAPSLAGSSSGITPHPHTAIVSLGARGHVLSAPKMIHFPAGMRAGYPPGLE